MKRCKCCVMPETLPGITFNEDGICCFCLDYEKEKYVCKEEGKAELERMIDSIKKDGNKYDCIVPLSGGRDSTYVLYMAKVIYDLKVLAVNYDNEFRNDQALLNMKNACERLGVDFAEVRSKRDVAHGIVKNSVGCSSSLRGYPLLGLCDACTYGYKSVVYRAAEEYQVPLILWGTSQGESTKNIQAKAFQGLTSKKSKLLTLFNISFYKEAYYLLLQRLEYPVRGNGILCIRGNGIIGLGGPILRNKDIKEISFFDYISWDRKQIKDTITRKLGWEKPRDHVSTWRTDCIIHTCMNYAYIKLFGCTKDCFGYCNMINMGQLDREEALKQEEEMLANLTEENVRELLEGKIGLSRKETNRVLSYCPSRYCATSNGNKNVNDSCAYDGGN